MSRNFLEDNDFSFWKNLILVIVFFMVTPIALITSLFSLVGLSKSTQAKAATYSQPIEASFFVAPRSGVKVFASLPSSFPSVSGSIKVVADARPEIIKNYLIKYNSPLVEYADLLVATADKYGLDYRLLTAIAQQESNLCKKIPPGSYNCWGWGIHSRGTLMFDSYEQAIEVVSRGLKKEYIDKGYTTPEEIMSKYTPLSNGSWAYGVQKFMREMQ